MYVSIRFVNEVIRLIVSIRFVKEVIRYMLVYDLLMR